MKKTKKNTEKYFTVEIEYIGVEQLVVKAKTKKAALNKARKILEEERNVLYLKSETVS